MDAQTMAALVRVAVDHCLSVIVCHCLSLSVIVCLCLSVSVCVCLSVSVSLSVSLSVFLCLSVCHCLSVIVGLSVCLPVCLPVCLSVCVCVHACRAVLASVNLDNRRRVKLQKMESKHIVSFEDLASKPCSSEPSILRDAGRTFYAFQGTDTMSRSPRGGATCAGRLLLRS